MSVALDAGEYDMYYSVQSEQITNTIRSTKLVAGGMTANTDTIVNYAGGLNIALSVALWHHSEFSMPADGMAFVIGTSVSVMNNTSTKLRILYRKKVSA